jgi:predicted transcriptional regulator
MYAAYIMKRTQIYLDDDQHAKLGRWASRSGVTKSALIREAINTYLESPTDDGQRLARFRSALAEVAGSPLALPDGRTFVEDLRAVDLRRQAELDRQRG